MFNDDDNFFFDESTPEAIEEDAILPDEEAAPQEEVTESEEDTKPSEEEAEPVTEPQRIKVKYNHEEKELTLEEAATLAQKGLNYDKIQEKLNALQSDPRLSFVEELARENNMTTEQYLEAVKEHREQQRLNELIQQNIPEDLAREILENRKFREQLQTKEKAAQDQEKQQAQFNEFVQTFPDVKPEEVPKEVWDKFSQGVPLKYAYMEHAYKQMQTTVQILKQNETNAKKAPTGSVTAHGGQEIAAEDDFLRGFNSI